MKQLLAVLTLAFGGEVLAQGAVLPRLHHVGLNSVDPERAIAWYLKLWPAAARVTEAGEPAVKADMLLLFRQVNRPPAGAWRNDLHRGEPQSAFWHIGAFANSSTLPELAARVGGTPLPLFISPEDTGSTWRSGLVPYAGTLTRDKLQSAPAAAPREGGFSYLVAPDGVLFEVTGGPDTRPSLSHIHFFHEQPLCAANWYVSALGMELPPVRDSAGRDQPRMAWNPCEVPAAEATWPSLEPVGTIRGPAGSVRYANGAMSWYPRQCTGSRCGRDQPLVPSRGQVLDHVAFEVTDFDAALARLRVAGVATSEPAHRFAGRRSVMIEGPDRLSIELVEGSAR